MRRVLYNALSSPGTGSDSIILEPLVQGGKRRDFGKKGTLTDTYGRLKRRAEKKGVSVLLHTGLEELRNRRERYYKNAVFCASTLVQEEDGRLTARYCNSRLCPICHGIRTAKARNKYMPLIQTFNDPHLLSLTQHTVSAGGLPRTVKRMYCEFSLASKTLGKRGTKLHGLRKLEINYNEQSGKYHPHFHCLVEGEEVGTAMLDQWLKRNRSTAQPAGQELQRILSGDIETLGRVFGYVTKPVTPYKNEDGAFVSSEILDVIISALYNKRILQPYGRLYGRGKGGERMNEPEALSYKSPMESRIGERVFWDWEQKLQTWVDRTTGELFDASSGNRKA